MRDARPYVRSGTIGRVEVHLYPIRDRPQVNDDAGAHRFEPLDVREAGLDVDVVRTVTPQKAHSSILPVSPTRRVVIGR